jgi:hypothetical protein
MPTPVTEPAPPDVLVHEPAEVYHAKAGEFLSSHLLADFRKCPLLYHRKRTGLVSDEDRPAYLVGRAAHTVILEGQEAFERAFAVGGPVNPKTGLPFGSGTKAWAEWAEAQGKDVLTSDQAQLVTQMAASVKAHPLAQRLLADGVAEGVVRSGVRGRPLSDSHGLVRSEHGHRRSQDGRHARLLRGRCAALRLLPSVGVLRRRASATHRHPPRRRSSSRWKNASRSAAACGR